jgi:hypothetical protein
LFLSHLYLEKSEYGRGVQCIAKPVVQTQPGIKKMRIGFVATITGYIRGALLNAQTR